MEEYFTADYLGVVLVGVLGGVVDQPVEVVGLEEGHFLVPVLVPVLAGVEQDVAKNFVTVVTFAIRGD